ncbi:hypothetical protein CFP56_024548 [Quercus suber]|uniref:DUF4283 domain-containing protein n=1 Tax=Quercus suber TaxID=58331 RepID=A0AAW0K7W7_QUESU
MEELIGKWARLSLNTRECQTIPLAPGVENNSKILVAKLFNKQRVNMEALLRTLKSMWRSIKDFEVRNLTSNTVLILFFDEADAMKIISQGLVNAKAIGSSLGRVEQVDASPNGECRGRYIQIRAQNPPKNPPSSSPIENSMISAPHPENAPTNKDISPNPNLFCTHLTEIDQALNSFQNLNKPTPPTQLANTSVTNIPKSPSTCPPKSTTTEKETNIVLMTHQLDTLSTITNHVTSLVHTKSNNSITSTSLNPVGPKTGSWCKLGLPRQIMDTNGPI